MIAQALLRTFFLGLAAAACALPWRWALGAAEAFARAVYALYRLTPHRGFLAANLRGAFPEATESELASLAQSHLRQLAASIVELMRFPLLSAQNIDDRVAFDGWEHVQDALARGHGLIVATAHFGNWELLGASLALKGVPLHALVQRPSQGAFDRLFSEFRSQVGVATWPLAGPASLRPLLRALRANEAVGLLADQHGESQDALVSFFGHSVSAPTGPFFFARATGAAVLPMFCIRQPDGTHRVAIEPAMAVSEDDAENAQALYALYETFIRRHPDHWLWVHDRWAREGELSSGQTPTLQESRA